MLSKFTGYGFLDGIMQDIRRLFKKMYGTLNDSIGIFGGYQMTISTTEGDISGSDLIKKLGVIFAEKGVVAITGLGIFHKKSGEVKQSVFLKRKETFWVYELCNKEKIDPGVFRDSRGESLWLGSAKKATAGGEQSPPAVYLS